MRLLVFAYVVMTLALSGAMIIHGGFWNGLVLIAGSLLGFVGGGGMRGAFYAGARKSGVILGLLLLFVGGGLLFYFDVTLSVLGLPFAGENWPFLGFAIAFLAARPEDAEVSIPSEGNTYRRPE